MQTWLENYLGLRYSANLKHDPTFTEQHLAWSTSTCLKVACWDPGRERMEKAFYHLGFNQNQKVTDTLDCELWAVLCVP